MAEHFLNASEVGSSLEEVGREGVPEQVWMNPFGLQPRFCCQAPQDQERAGPGQRAALGVEKELAAVLPVQMRSPAGQVTKRSPFALAMLLRGMSL